MNGRLRIRVLDGIQHTIEVMGFDDYAARPDLGHRLLWRILSFDLLSLGLFGLRPVSFEYAVAQPFLLRTL